MPGAISALAVLAGLVFPQVGGCDKQPPEPRGQALMRVTWRDAGDSLVVESIDYVPGAPRPEEKPRAPDLKEPDPSALPLPQPLRAIAPTPRDRRSIDATVLTLHDAVGRVVDARIIEDRSTVFLDGYGPAQGGPRPLEPPVRSVTFRVRPAARFLVWSAYRFPAPGEDPGPGRWDGRARFLIPPDRPRPGEGPSKGVEREAWLRLRGLVDLAPRPRDGDERNLWQILDPDPRDFPDSLDFGNFLPDPAELKRVLGFMRIWGHRAPPLLADETPFLAGGTYLGHETLHFPTEPVYPTEGTAYRIAILGDGFDSSAADQERFAHYSERFKEAFLAEPPFDSVRETVWIARVRFASNGSGISYCSVRSDSIETYFRVRGCYVADQPAACGVSDATGGSTPTYLGVDDVDLWRIREAGRKAFDGKPAHLHVLLANCEERGGRADSRPLSRTAFVALPPAEVQYAVDSDCHYDWMTLDDAGRDSVFASVALHESAHVMAGLMDEYVGCDSWDGKPWPNLATGDDVDQDLVPWLPAGSDAPIHRQGEAPCDGRHNWIHDETAAAHDEPGAYWGCAYVSAAAAALGCGCTWTNPDGRDFFRPQGRCKMRVTRWPFCTVCADTLKHTVLDPPLIEDE